MGHGGVGKGWGPEGHVRGGWDGGWQMVRGGVCRLQMRLAAGSRERLGHRLSHRTDGAMPPPPPPPPLPMHHAVGGTWNLQHQLPPMSHPDPPKKKPGTPAGLTRKGHVFPSVPLNRSVP